jgi:hypothetical protein
MALLITVVLGLVALTAIALWVGALLASRRYRGTMLITCPETTAPEAVVVDWRHAASTGLLGAPELRLADCTRWPERQGCGQMCLQQVEAAPESCLVKGILTHFYEGKACAICERPFGEIHWHDHKPALLDKEKRTLEWSEVPPQTLHEVLETHRPVCWNCHIAQTFRREHADLVTDRPHWPPPPIG